MFENSRQKQERIVDMFDDIASSYDITNRILTFGIDKSWRKNSIQRALALCRCSSSDFNIVDVACGTGDMLALWNRALVGRTFSLVGVDPSLQMLDIARERFYGDSIKFYEGFAQDLHMLESKSVDMLSIAFGIRNVVDLNSAICEFSRVLKQNGILLILEFMKTQGNGVLNSLVSLYSKKILPIVGGLISKNYAAYTYLPNSIDDFKTSTELGEILRSHNLIPKVQKTYGFGVATLLLCQNDKGF